LAGGEVTRPRHIPQVVYGRLPAPSRDPYAARFDFASLASGAGNETGVGLSRLSTVR
jgi:hypothetical protein